MEKVQTVVCAKLAEKRVVSKIGLLRNLKWLVFLEQSVMKNQNKGMITIMNLFKNLKAKRKLMEENKTVRSCIVVDDIIPTEYDVEDSAPSSGVRKELTGTLYVVKDNRKRG